MGKYLAILRTFLVLKNIRIGGGSAMAKIKLQIDPADKSYKRNLNKIKRTLLLL